jgi:diguanylate cyclase (GGDEF)-like protein
MDEGELYRRRFLREREARRQAEAIIEAKSRELYLKGQELERAIVAERLARREVERLSITDPLTGLANRRHLAVVATSEFLRAQRHGHALSSLMLDIDHFKRVNDRYGHETGDRVLAGVAEACQAGLRVTDVAARYGGEEFCFLLPETSEARARILAERLRVAIEGLRFEANGQEFGITGSLGVAERHDADGSWEDMLRRSDQALYQAKEEGRNRVVVRVRSAS